MDFKSLIKRFLSGVAVGLLGALLAWFYSVRSRSAPSVSAVLVGWAFSIYFFLIICHELWQ